MQKIEAQGPQGILVHPTKAVLFEVFLMASVRILLTLYCDRLGMLGSHGCVIGMEAKGSPLPVTSVMYIPEARVRTEVAN